KSPSSAKALLSRATAPSRPNEPSRCPRAALRGYARRRRVGPLSRLPVAGCDESGADVDETGAEGPIVTLSDDIVTLRPWSRDDAEFMAGASADPAIRRYNGVLDRLGHPAPPLSIHDAETVIDEFALSWQGFATTGTPSGGVAFA